MEYPTYSCHEGPNKEIALEIIQKTAGVLSIIGSGLIVSDVLRKLLMKKENNGLINRTDSYQRIMLGLSFFDITYNFFLSFLGSWMTPQETGWLMSIGNQATCTAQGFFAQFGIMGSTGYQIALSLNILLLIAFGWSQEKFARTMEIPMHIFIFVVSLVYSIVPVPLESYNAYCGWCTFGALMYECDGSAVHGELCVERGSPRIRLIYSSIELAAIWGMIIFCTLAMIWVYMHVRRQEARQAVYNFPGDQTQNYHRESRRIRKILLLYTLVLYVSWGVPYSLWVRYEYRREYFQEPFPFGVNLAIALLYPCGFFNMLVYFLPNYLKYQKTHPGTWLVMSYWHVLMSSSAGICCSWCSKLLKSVVAGFEDATTDEMIADSPDMNFASYNTSHNIDTNASLSRYGDENGSGSGSQTEENKTTIALVVNKGSELDMVHITNYKPTEQCDT